MKKEAEKTREIARADRRFRRRDTYRSGRVSLRGIMVYIPLGGNLRIEGGRGDNRKKEKEEKEKRKKDTHIISFLSFITLNACNPSDTEVSPKRYIYHDPP